MVKSLLDYYACTNSSKCDQVLCAHNKDRHAGSHIYLYAWHTLYYNM